MSKPTKLNLKAYKGRSFAAYVPLVTDTLMYKPVQEASKTAPLKLAVLKHEVPDQWQVRVTGAKGMKELNDLDFTVSVVSKDVLEVNKVNASTYLDYLGGGVLAYYMPLKVTTEVLRLQLLQNNQTVLEKSLVYDPTMACAVLDLSFEETTALINSAYSLRIDLISGNLILPVAVGTLILAKE